mmetsp:Transcript_4100/g.4514  ORF Transcript_4100/g.4514 Transcript_4100/m.4514 type:complete len:92 (+) Transcript_4100:594-869(+)
MKMKSKMKTKMIAFLIAVKVKKNYKCSSSSFLFYSFVLFFFFVLYCFYLRLLSPMYISSLPLREVIFAIIILFFCASNLLCDHYATDGTAS